MMINNENMWLSWQGDPIVLLQTIEYRCSDRKLRLFFSGCVRLLWSDLHDTRSKAAVVANEQYADATATEAELIEARREAYQAWFEAASSKMDAKQDHLAAAAMMAANEDVEFSRGVTGRIEAASPDFSEINTRMSKLLRSVLGNPFRQLPADLLATFHADDTLKATAKHYYQNALFGDRWQLPLDGQILSQLDNYDTAWLSYTTTWCRGNWLVDAILGYN